MANKLEEEPQPPTTIETEEQAPPVPEEGEKTNLQKDFDKSIS